MPLSQHAPPFPAMALLARRVRLRCRPALLSSPARAMSADRGAPRFKVVRPPPPEVLYGRPEDMHAETPEGAKTLHVTMLGPPNAGKSVLTNRFVQSTVRSAATRRPALLARSRRLRQVTAASSKYHTTRRRMVGVMTREKSQVCLYDTPGVVEPRCVLACAHVPCARPLTGHGVYACAGARDTASA